MNLVKETRRKPRNTNSSSTGARIAVTTNRPPNVAGSGEIIFTTSSTVLAPSFCTFQLLEASV